VLVRRDGPGGAESVVLDARPRRVLSVSQDGRWAVVSRDPASRESWYARDVVSVAGGGTVLDFGELHVTVGFHRRRPWAYWASSEDPRLRLFDLEAKKELAVRDGPDPRIPVAFEAELADGDAAHPDGLVAATCGTEGKDTWVGDAATLRTFAVVSGHSEFSQFRFSRATGRLFTASLDDTVACWDLARPGEPLWRIPAGDIIDPLGLAVSPRGDTLAVAPIDGTLRLLDGATGRPRAVLRGAARSMSLMGADPRRTVIDYAPDGTRVLTLQDDATVLLWDPEAHDAPTTLRGHAGFVYDVEFSPDGALLASCGWDGFVGKPGGVRLWDPRTGDAVASFGSDTEFFSRVAWSADGRRLYACARSMRGEPPRVLCVDRDTGRRLESPALLDWNLSFDPSRTRAVVCEPLEPWTPTVAPGKQLRAVRVLDLATGVAGARGPTTRDSDLEVRFLGPDLIAYDGGDGAVAVAVADAATLVPKLLLRGHTARPWSVARSPDGTLIATGASDGSVRLWDARTGAPAAVLPGHGSTALGIEFSRDGRLVVVGGQDGHVHLWDAEHFEEIASLPGHTNYVKDVAFSPDGATLASASGDGTVRIWSAEPLAVRLAARRERAELAALLRPRIEALLLRKGVFDEIASAAAAELRADASLAPRAREVALQTLLAEAVARRAR
jgi:WD40 repeat protein